MDNLHSLAIVGLAQMLNDNKTSPTFLYYLLCLSLSLSFDLSRLRNLKTSPNLHRAMSVCLLNSGQTGNI